MINTSNEYKQAIQGNRTFYTDVKITIPQGDVFNISRENLFGLSIEDNVSGTTSFDIGSAIINQLTLKLDNTDGRYDQYNFDQAQITVKIGLQLSNTIEWMNKGVYTADPGENNGALLTIKAYDNMRRFDLTYANSKLQYPATLGAIVRDACSVCGVSLATSSFDMDNYVVKARPQDEALTFREVLNWVGQIGCLWCRCNASGALELRFYDVAGYEKDTGHFFNIRNLASSNITTGDVAITGVKVVQDIEKEEGSTTIESLSGQTGYVIGIDGNGLIQPTDGQTIADKVGDKLIGLRFRKLSITHQSDPSIEAGDLIKVTDRKGKTYKTFVTGTTFLLGNNQKTECSAESPSRNSADRFSQSTKNYVKLREQVKSEKTARELAIENLAGKLASSSGLYMTSEKQEDGSTIYFMHNTPTLQGSDIVWKLTAEAFGISTDGGNTYPYGFTVTGEMITRLLYAQGINADYIDTGAFTVRDDDGNIIFQADIATGQVIISGDSVRIGSQSATQAIQSAAESADAASRTAQEALSAAAQARNMAMQLSNDYQSIPVDNKGNYSVFPSCTTRPTVMYGAEDITADCIFTIIESSSVTGTWDNSKKTFTAASLTADTGWVDIKAAYLGTLAIVKRFTLAKLYEGKPGEAFAWNIIPGTKEMKDYARHGTVTMAEDAEGFAAASFAATDEASWRAIESRPPILLSTVRNKQVTFSFLIRSADWEALNADAGHGLFPAFSLCTATSASRTKYHTQDFTTKKLSDDWQKIIWTCTLTDALFSQGTGTIDDTTRLYVIIYNFSRWRMEIKKIKVEFGDMATGWSPSEAELEGEAGRGIKSTAVTYQASASGTAVPSGGWAATIPSVAANQYLWTRTVITYTDNTSTIMYSVGKMGATGAQGAGISSVVEHYAVSASSSTVPASWLTTPPTMTATNKYLWNYETITYTDGKSSDTEKRVIGAYGDKGADGTAGKGIKSITNYYLATASASGVTTSTSGWTTAVQTVSNSKKYLWNYEIITYTDSTASPTAPCIIGAYGDTGSVGKGIKSIIEYYAVSSSNATVPASWLTTVPTMTSAHKYLWNYEVITYTDNSAFNTEKRVIGAYGTTGDDGVGISTVTNYYLATGSSSGVTASTAGWTTSVQSVSAGKKYLWNYEKITYTNGSGISTSPCIIGVYGDTGAAGNGVAATAVTYQASTSGTNIPAGTWSKSIPSVAANQYLWTRTVISYTNGTSSTAYSIGKMGANGTNGAPGRVYMLDCSTNVIKRAKDDTMVPSYIDFAAYYRDGTSASRTAYAGRFKIEESSDGSTWSTMYQSSGDEPSVRYALYTFLTNDSGDALMDDAGYGVAAPRNISAVRCSMYAAGGTTTMLDTQNIIAVKDVDALSHEEIFSLLTNNGDIKGIYKEGNQLYISFTYAKGGQLVLGGTDNLHGYMQLYDKLGNKSVQLDNRGMELRYGQLSCLDEANDGEIVISSGAVNFRYRGQRCLQIFPMWWNATAPNSHGVHINVDQEFLGISRRIDNSTSRTLVVINNGVNLNGYNEEVLVYATARFTQRPVLQRGISLGNCTISQTNNNQIIFSYDEGIPILTVGYNVFSINNLPGGVAHCWNNLDLHGKSLLNSSDERLKDNIQPCSKPALNTVNNINLYEFDWLTDGSHEEIGYVAQQVEEVEPDLAYIGQDGSYAVKESKLIRYLWKAVQELSQEIGVLKKQLREGHDFNRYTREEKMQYAADYMNKMEE